MEKTNDLPDHMTDMSMFKRQPDISQKKRDTLLHFNTIRYWHCYYDPETDLLYDEYGYKLLDKAFDYLLERNMINDKKQKIKYFEE